MASPQDGAKQESRRLYLARFHCRSCNTDSYHNMIPGKAAITCQRCNSVAYREDDVVVDVQPHYEKDVEETSEALSSDNVPYKPDCCRYHRFEMGIEGMGPNAPTYTTPTGGRHSDTGYLFTEIDPKAVFVLAAILARGSKKYGRSNWRAISVEDNLEHVLGHTFAYLAGDTSDDHLGDALCRAMFALAVHIQGGADPRYANRSEKGVQMGTRHLGEDGAAQSGSYELSELRGKGI
jgi:hypothetical protein